MNNKYDLKKTDSKKKMIQRKLIQIQSVMNKPEHL